MSRFIPTPTARPATLYHAIPGIVRGEAIEPGINYRAPLLPEEREKLGLSPDEHRPLVFAATTLGKALAFTIKGEKFFNHSFDSVGAEIVVAPDRDAFMSKPRHATVYSFPDTGFVKLPNMQHQSVSTAPVPFAQADKTLIINSIEDVMRAGLQIFTFKDDFKTLEGDKDVEALCTAKDDGTRMRLLGQLIKSGTVVWENQARGLSPNTALGARLGLGPRPRPASGPRP